MSSKERPQYQPDKRNFFPLRETDALIKRLVVAQTGAADYRLHEKYQGLLLKVLPPLWRHQVYFDRIEKGVWHLLVADSEAAFKLRFLQNEIMQALNAHLDKPARLRIHVQPDLWQLIPQSRRLPAVKKAATYTEAEAESSIRQRLARLVQKT